MEGSPRSNPARKGIVSGTARGRCGGAIDSQSEMNEPLADRQGFIHLEEVILEVVFGVLLLITVSGYVD